MRSPDMRRRCSCRTTSRSIAPSATDEPTPAHGFPVITPGRERERERAGQAAGACPHTCHSTLPALNLSRCIGRAKLARPGRTRLRGRPLERPLLVLGKCRLARRYEESREHRRG